MDVNGTKFHLLLTRDDWGRCTSGQNVETLQTIWKRETDPEQKFDWDEYAGEITLQKQIFKFTTSPKDEKPELEKRRGAARDRYGNWYWIDETGLKIKVLSSGSNNVSDFYPAREDNSEEVKQGAFQPVEQPAQTPLELRGLAVTIDHFLVVGTLAPAGLLVFDLFAGGAPRRVLWRPEAPFLPFDMAARRGGGVFVLDRANKQYWTLDRNFNAVGGHETKGLAEDFQPVDEGEERKTNQPAAAEDYFSNLPEMEDPISIEALPDDTVLILDLPANKEDFSVVYRYYRAQRLDKLETKSILSKVDEPKREILSPPRRFRLRGFDLAFVDANPGSKETEKKHDRLFIVSEEGNQAFTFKLVCQNDSKIFTSPPFPAEAVANHFELQAIAEYFPLRLFGGKGLAAADGQVYYDFGERWLALKKQNRPSFEITGTLETPAFDGKEPNCVWHRLLLDGCLPPETRIDVFSRTAAVKADLPLSEWRKEPPLYRRGDGSEIPFAGGKNSKEKGSGTWELLLQRAKNRYLQLRLVFHGNGQRTPRISALRVYYPRFSYLENYLPAIYRENDQSAFFLDGFLANIEGFYTALEDRIAAVQMLFDVRSAPPDALEWLADWLGAALDPAWTEDKRRLFITRAVDFFQYRGTLRGIRIALRLALDNCADESIFEPQTREQKRRDSIRIVERFQTRRTPQIIPPDSAADQNLPRVIEQTEKWKPAQGADVLNQRFRAKFKDKPALKFSPMRPAAADEAAVWERFALEALGFVPSDAAATERKHWQAFLRDEYQSSLTRLNQAQATVYQSFDEIFLPRGTETNGALQDDWLEFIEKSLQASRVRKLWQDFLARRYRRIGRLNEVYSTNWSSFEYVSLFDRLPLSEKPLSDWVQFEGGVLPMHRTAHRFTVMIPALLNGGKAESVAEQNRKLELVRRVVELEKPAHTVFDFRFYWNLFRLDEVRLGTDTLLGLGSRDPLLNPDLIIGQSFIGESRLGTEQPEKYTERYVLGNEFLEKK
jgi:phage tail-like protein